MKKTMSLLTCLTLFLALLTSCDNRQASNGGTADQSGDPELSTSETKNPETTNPVGTEANLETESSNTETDTGSNSIEDDSDGGLELSFFFIVKEDSIEVFDAKSGALFQTLEFDAVEDLERAKELFSTEDMNFDGVADIRLPSNFGAYSVTYDCWLWDAAANEYVINEQLSGLMTPSFDQKNKTVSETVHTSAAESAEVVYDWNNGALQELGRVETCYADDGVTLVTRTWARDSATGEMVMTAEEPYQAEN